MFNKKTPEKLYSYREGLITANVLAEKDGYYILDYLSGGYDKGTAIEKKVVNKEGAYGWYDDLDKCLDVEIKKQEEYIQDSEKRISELLALKKSV